jgi:hypothetical protein
MQRSPDSYRKYHSAADRFFKPAIVNFFAKEFPSLFGPTIRENIADELMTIFDKLNPDKNFLKPGQIFWNALHKNTRADSPKRKYVPVILTIINQQDIEQLEKGVSITDIKQNSIARIIKEAYQQGGILSMRDVSLLLLMDDSYATVLRQRYELQNNVALPHTGNLHDMGSCVSHKTEIIRKVVVEKKDPTQTAYETNHSQWAVDRYLNDFHRVNTLYKDNHDIEYINSVTNISKPVIKQYINIIEKYVKEH